MISNVDCMVAHVFIIDNAVVYHLYKVWNDKWETHAEISFRSCRSRYLQRALLQERHVEQRERERTQLK